EPFVVHLCLCGSGERQHAAGQRGGDKTRVRRRQAHGSDPVSLANADSSRCCAKQATICAPRQLSRRTFRRRGERFGAPCCSAGMDRPAQISMNKSTGTNPRGNALSHMQPTGPFPRFRGGDVEDFVMRPNGFWVLATLALVSPALMTDAAA